MAQKTANSTLWIMPQISPLTSHDEFSPLSKARRVSRRQSVPEGSPSSFLVVENPQLTNRVRRPRSSLPLDINEPANGSVTLSKLHLGETNQASRLGRKSIEFTAGPARTPGQALAVSSPMPTSTASVATVTLPTVSAAPRSPRRRRSSALLERIAATLGCLTRPDVDAPGPDPCCAGPSTTRKRCASYVDSEGVTAAPPLSLRAMRPKVHPQGPAGPGPITGPRPVRPNHASPASRF